jgi:hypothetical protein
MLNLIFLKIDTYSRYIWSALHPIGWWRNDEMKFYYDKKSYLFGSSRGRNWPEDQCRWYFIQLSVISLNYRSSIFC